MTRRRATPLPPRAPAPDALPAASNEEAAEAAPAPLPVPPVDVEVAALLEVAGVACRHTVVRSRHTGGGKWVRYCEACGQSWPLDG